MVELILWQGIKAKNLSLFHPSLTSWMFNFKFEKDMCCIRISNPKISCTTYLTLTRITTISINLSRTNSTKSLNWWLRLHDMWYTLKCLVTWELFGLEVWDAKHALLILGDEYFLLLNKGWLRFESLTFCHAEF